MNCNKLGARYALIFGDRRNLREVRSEEHAERRTRKRERLRNRGAYSLMPNTNPVAIPIEDHTVATAFRLPHRDCRLDARGSEYGGIQRREERRDESRRRRHECPAPRISFMQPTVPLDFPRRSEAHAHLRTAPRLRRRLSRAADGLVHRPRDLAVSTSSPCANREGVTQAVPYRHRTRRHAIAGRLQLCR